MKISFIIPFAAMSGGNRVVSIYACKMQERGHEVLVVSQPARTQSLRQKLSRWWQNKTVLTGKTKAPVFDELGDAHVVLDRRRPPISSDLPDADIIVATWWKTAEWVAALPPEKGRKVYLLQDYETFDRQIEDVVATYSLPLQKLAVSSYIRDSVARHDGAGEIAMIPNSVDLEHFNAPPRAKNKTLKVGFLYTKSPRKNVALALEALHLAKERLPHLQVLAFGGKPPSKDLPLPEWIDYHISPPQTQIPKLYAACDLWLFTSLHEGFGLPLLEAMACRTPVLATSAGAAPDLITASNGCLLEGRADAFSDAIVHFDDMSDDHWRQMSEAAYRSTHSYSWDDATDRFVNYLEAMQ